MKKHFLLLATAASLIYSCSGKPSLDELESSLNEMIKSESNDKIELTNLEKTNSVDKEIFGQKMYSVEYEATIKFKEDCYIYYNKSGYGPMFESFRTYTEEPEFIPSLQMQVTLCEKNKEFTYQGIANYVETEEGWVLNN